MAIKIIADSTCDISLDAAKDMGVEIIPIKINIDDVIYADKYELTLDEFYQKLPTTKNTPVTTLITPQEFVDVFNKYPDDEIIGIFLSHKLSGTFQSACIAKADLGRDDIHLIDSGSVTFAVALLVERAVKLAECGLSVDEICRKIEALAPKLEIYAVVDTLKYLVKGGRLTGVQGVIGSLWGVKPIIRVKDGVVENVGKERGFARALDSLMELIKTKCRLDYNMPIAFAHTQNEIELENLKLRFDGKTGDTYSVGPVVGSHAGPGVVAVAFFNE